MSNRRADKNLAWPLAFVLVLVLVVLSVALEVQSEELVDKEFTVEEVLCGGLEQVVPGIAATDSTGS